MKNLISPSLALFLISVLSATAQVAITVSGTMDGDGGGYSSGQLVSFTFTVSHNSDAAWLSSFDTTHNTWGLDTYTNNPIFTDFSGTGIQGAYIPPFEGSEIPDELLDFNDSWVTINLARDGTSLPEILSPAPSSDPFDSFTIDVNTSAFASLNNQVSDPGLVDWLTSVAGTYAVVENDSFFTIDGSPYNITPTELTIAAVPEPSTFALATGALVLLLVAYRRRQFRNS